MTRHLKTCALLPATVAAVLAPALPCAAAYVRGELVWKCDFTPEEAARYGVAGHRLHEAGRDQYELTNYPYLNIGSEDFQTNSGSGSKYTSNSFFGRLIYSYAKRYLLQANVRHDGSSRFAKNYRWGTFPSFSAGWVVSEEPFMQRAALPWLSFLKLRASWGKLGNEHRQQLLSLYRTDVVWQQSIL